MKQEWRKHEKQFYLPVNKPEVITIPTFNFFSIKGKGNPNDASFGEYIEVLYALSYAVKMSPKIGKAPEDYFEYTVYPLEGVWDIEDEDKPNFIGIINKDRLVFDLMIRQPDFVTAAFAAQIIDLTKKKKNLKLLDNVRFETFDEGKCIQMLHNGSYDNEPTSFKMMEAFAITQNLKRKHHLHREIYLSDARKIAPDKLKTVLRFQLD